MKTKEETALHRREYYLKNKENFKKKNAEHYLKNREIRLENAVEYYINNKEKIIEDHREYRLNNKEEIKKYKRKYYINKKKLINKNCKIYYLNNAEKIGENKKEYRLNNKEKINEREKIYEKNRRATDNLFKLTQNIRCLIGEYVRRNGYKKTSKTQDVLGCTFSEFKIYLESKFEPWMNWSNHGNWNGNPQKMNVAWDIDHIIPISSVTTEEEIIKLNHYTNLQPLCSYINRHVKRDKIN